MKQENKFLITDTIIVMVFVIIITCIVSCCSSNGANENAINSLKEQIAQRDILIKEYEDFRQLSKDIYINQVDSTGDGFDESDQGVDFWRIYERIDTLTHTSAFD